MLTVYKIRAEYIITLKGTNQHSEMQTDYVSARNSGTDLIFSSLKEAQDHMETLPVSKTTGDFVREYQYAVEAVEYKYANMHGWTDIIPFEIVRVVSPKTIEIRAMDGKIEEDFKPDAVAGGYFGHTKNQDEQRYSYKSLSDAPVIKARLGKKGWKSQFGRHVLNSKPVKFYDYNF